jgi:hypothetical protein
VGFYEKNYSLIKFETIPKLDPVSMEYKAAKRNLCPASLEKRSVRLLIEKMGLSKKELEQISEQYGVSASQLVEVIQYSKYQFVHQHELTPGQFQP